MEMLDQGVHDDNCFYELVLNSESIPPKVTMQHLLQNPQALLQFARKKAKWKKVDVEESHEEGQLPSTPDMICASSSVNNKQQIGTSAHNRFEQIRLEDFTICNDDNS